MADSPEQAVDPPVFLYSQRSPPHFVLLQVVEFLHVFVPPSAGATEPPVVPLLARLGSGKSGFRVSGRRDERARGTHVSRGWRNHLGKGKLCPGLVTTALFWSCKRFLHLATVPWYTHTYRRNRLTFHNICGGEQGTGYARARLYRGSLNGTWMYSPLALRLRPRHVLRLFGLLNPPCLYRPVVPRT